MNERPSTDDPGTQAKARTTGLFDRAAETYDQVGVDFFSIFGERLVQLAALSPGERVLDVGCGRGAVLFPAAQAVAPGGSVLGIDLSSAMVERCAAEVAARGLDGVEVRVDDAEHPEVAPGSFDAVLAGLVIFFLPDPGAALDSFRTALAPDGRLAMTTFGAEDDRFAPVFGAVAAHIPPPPGADGDDGVDDGVDGIDDGEHGVPDRPARAQDGPFASSGSITALLGEHGFGSVDHLEVDYGIEFRDPDHWIEWSWSHGARQLWEMIDDADRPAAHATAVEALSSLAEPDGSLLHQWRVRYTIARR